MTTNDVRCVIGQADCGLKDGETQCGKCGLRPADKFVSREDLDLAVKKAERLYSQSYAKALEMQSKKGAENTSSDEHTYSMTNCEAISTNSFSMVCIDYFQRLVRCNMGMRMLIILLGVFAFTGEIVKLLYVNGSIESKVAESLVVAMFLFICVATIRFLRCAWEKIALKKLPLIRRIFSYFGYGLLGLFGVCSALYTLGMPEGPAVQSEETASSRVVVPSQQIKAR